MTMGIIEVALPATWREHQAELLDDWIREHPGTRPWASA
jgi:hypothetical protein